MCYLLLSRLSKEASAFKDQLIPCMYVDSSHTVIRMNSCVYCHLYIWVKLQCSVKFIPTTKDMFISKRHQALRDSLKGCIYFSQVILQCELNVFTAKNMFLNRKHLPSNDRLFLFLTYELLWTSCSLPRKCLFMTIKYQVSKNQLFPCVYNF